MKFLQLTAMGAVAQAMALEGTIAQPTGASTPGRPALSVAAPQTTTPPSAHELLRRLNVQSVLVAPDNTCGYVDRQSQLAFHCSGTSQRCVLITSAAVTLPGSQGCCDVAAGTCNVQTACADRAGVAASKCDAACLANSAVAKCTEASAAYCGVVSFFSGIQGYYCDSTSVASTRLAYTTYSGQTARSYSVLAITVSDTPSSAAASSARASSSPVSSSSSGGSSAASSAGSSAAAASSTGSTDNGNGGTSSAPIGAIVGGVIGGVAVLALIGLGVWLMLSRKNKKQAAATTTGNHYQQQQPPPNMQQQHQYPQQPMYSDNNAVSPQLTGQTQVPYYDPSKSPATAHMQQQQAMSPMSTGTSNAATTHVQQQTPAVYEAGGDAVGAKDGNHRGQFHELS